MSIPNRQVAILLGVTALVGMTTACTKITGLDSDYTELSCFPSGSCDASTDGRASASGSASGEDGGPATIDGSSTLGAPTISCSPGTISCAAGCVSPTEIHYCGSCTNDCAKLPNVDIGNAGSTVACNAGRCTYACSAGYADCADAGTGCATNLGSSASCGACGGACTTAAPLCAPTAAGGAASAYACAQSCPASAPTTCMGSCVDEQTSSTSCGGCGPSYACAAGTNCVGGHCVGPTLSISPSQYAFAATTVGAKSAGAPFVVSNSGNGTSGTLSVGIGGANASEFSLAADACTGQTLAPGASCTISVVFSPASRGGSAASLDIDGGQIFTSLTGSGQDSVTLTVTKSGAGGGTVAGGPISCGSTCSGSVSRTSTTNPIVTLTATPAASSVFGGWSGGGCTGTGTTCNVTMSQAQTVNAEFDKQTVPLTVAARVFGASAGTIASSPAGVNCTAPCSQTVNVPPGTQVSVSTTGGPNVWWGSSSCTGTTCVTTVNAAMTLTATFSNNNYVFATSKTYAGSLGGLTGADALCAQAATSSGLLGHYVAWLATSTTNALTRLGSARGWIGTSGLPFADTTGVAGGKTGIRNGQIYYPPTYTEFGTTNSSSIASSWTGANEDGSLATGYNCNDWTDGTTSFSGAAGFQTYGSTEWTYEFVSDCTGSSSVYCFGVDSSNSVTIPAPTGRIAFLSSGTFNPASGISAADSLCQSEASQGGFASASTFLAFLPTASASAISRFSQSGAPWQRPDGIALAPTAAGILGTLAATPTERGDGSYLTNEGGDYVWVGSAFANMAGTMGSTCNDWATNSSSTIGATGNAASPYTWLNSSTDPCSYALPVYCFQQ